MNQRKVVLLLATIPLLTMPALAGHNERKPAREFRADLMGQNESPLTLSAGRGSLELSVNEMDTSVHFVLHYEGLTTPVAQAHIHVGQPDINGAVTVFFCGGTTRPPCPASPATVEGDFVANDVIGIPSQQLEATNLAKLLMAIRAGQTYGNVHTQTSPGGEIRGQIRADRHHGNGNGNGNGNDDDDDDDRQ